MIAPGQPMNRDQAFRLALVIERRARTEARAWADRLPQQALLLARGRADQVIEPNQKSRDPLRAALAREWYVRVFQDQVRHDLGQTRPELAVTAVEAEHVAECLTHGKAYRIHGPGGSLVLNPDAPETVPGQAGFAGRDADDTARPPSPDGWHREQLEQLAAEQDRRRGQDERLVAAAWDDLTQDERTAFAAYFHQYRGTTGPAAYPRAEARRRPRRGRDPDRLHPDRHRPADRAHRGTRPGGRRSVRPHRTTDAGGGQRRPRPNREGVPEVGAEATHHRPHRPDPLHRHTNLAAAPRRPQPLTPLIGPGNEKTSGAPPPEPPATLRKSPTR